MSLNFVIRPYHDTHYTQKERDILKRLTCKTVMTFSRYCSDACRLDGHDQHSSPRYAKSTDLSGYASLTNGRARSASVRRPLVFDMRCMRWCLLMYSSFTGSSTVRRCVTTEKSNYPGELRISSEQRDGAGCTHIMDHFFHRHDRGTVGCLLWRTRWRRRP